MKNSYYTPSSYYSINIVNKWKFAEDFDCYKKFSYIKISKKGN